MAQVRLISLEKNFDSFRALDGVSLTVEDGELFALLGSSGSGKTTALRCLAGLEHPTSGDIVIGGQSVLSAEPFERPCGMVFQSYALFPHLTVFENVAYGLRAREYVSAGPIGKAKVLGSFVSRSLFPVDGVTARRVRDALALVDLSSSADKLPGQLSGGMQQRVALARAIVTEPKVLLLDEPLSNLDRKLRISMRTMIRKLQQQLKMTALYVTHDQEEALSLADRIAIMSGGRVAQLGAPAEIYDRPVNAFVADFIGAENLMPGEIVEVGSDGAVAVRVGSLTVRSVDERKSGKVCVVVKPQGIRVTPRGTPLDEENCYRGVIRFATYLGATARYEVEVEGVTFVVDVPDPRPADLLKQGAEVNLGFSSKSVILVNPS
jgi:ABC-type Fe3+/spermidine/putrescine transport system ATPase subunit